MYFGGLFDGTNFYSMRTFDNGLFVIYQVSAGLK
jgi:hypothetical protein